MKKTAPSELIVGSLVTLKKHSPEISQTIFNAVEFNRQRLSEFLPWVEKTKTIADQNKYVQMTLEKWDLFELFDFGIYLNSTGEYLGNIGAHSIKWDDLVCEVGYWIIESHEGKGLVSQALKLLEKELFKCGFLRLEIRCDPSNPRSSEVAKRNGYLLEGTLRENKVINQIRRSTLVFGKLKTDR